MKSRYFAVLFLALTLLRSSAQSDGWQSIAVPGAWEEKGPAAAKNYDGVAWYRTWVKPHDGFFAKHERNLFEESVSINIRDLADAHEIYLNGKKLGAGGQFPPNFRSGKGEIHRHKVPVGTLRKGEWNEIAIRVYNRSGPGGFLGEAPFIMNYFIECVFDGPWQFRLGDDASWPGPALKAKPAASSFKNFIESSRVLGRSEQFVTGDRLPPAESYAKMHTSDELAVDLMVSEPQVAQPVHFSFDERGRLWVAQYRQYPYPAGLKMISRDKYYRSHYDKVPPPPPNHDRGADIISIHEDTNGDGKFDRHKVFQDGLNMANAAIRGYGGVWVMHTPYLLFYPDRNFDDRPDGPPEVRLQGFGLEDTHSVANGLVWGMDGWLYGGQGSTTSSHVTRPGDTNAPVYFEGCMVWRYHPVTRAYEIFAEGSGNTFGLEVDAQGRLYSGHNGGTTRGWHYVQGGYYLKQGVDPGKFGPPRNPYSFGQLPLMKSETTIPRFSHFLALAEGSAIPAKYSGMLFSIDPLHNTTIASERKVLGATFATVDVGPVLSSTDVAFRPVYIGNAPDGSLYIADMYEYYIAHGQHYQSNIDPSTGRIYRLRGKNEKLETDLDLTKKSTSELVALLSHPNKWHRHTAVRLLAERKDSRAASQLKQVIEEDKDLGALNALWALYQMGRLDDTTALKALGHTYAPVRMWAVRLLGEKYGTNAGLGVGSRRPGTLSAQMAEALVSFARRETDAEVRSQFACTARRLPVKRALSVLAALLGHDADIKDPYIPQLCWWVLESNASVNRDEIIGLLMDKSLWDHALTHEYILPRLMRRYALEGKRADLLTCAQLLRMAPAPKHAAQLMAGFEEAYRGRSMAGLPDELAAAIDASGQSPLILRVRRGDAAAVTEALKIVQNAKAKIEDRLLYARAFGEVKQDSAVPVLLGVAANDAQNALRKAALAALGAYESDSIGAKVVELLPKLKDDARTAAFALLASRPNWGLSLLQAVQSGSVKPNTVPPNVADRLRQHKEPAVAGLVAKFFPKQDPAAAAQFQKKMAEVETALKRGAGSPYPGETIFMERCAGCHKLFFKGGNVGPELTNYQRDNLGTMLISIVNPNAEIREGFQYYIVETKDGRSLSGFLVERDTQVTVLRGLEGEDIILRQSEIKDLQPMGQSLMPEGLLEGLDEKQLRDLFAYLRISQPITK
ncbi:MAG: PVC-type heme-binding CxxCH protein [Verrucomicrobiota bacterium]